MALNDHIERWALQQSVDRLALAVANGQVTLDDLGDIARRKPVFASKFALVQQQLEAMPNPKEQEDFDRIKSDYDSLLRGEEQLTLMQSYLAKWSANSAAADRVRMVKEWYGEIKEDRDFSRLKDRAEADIAAYNQTGKIPSVEIVQALQMYLNEWKCSGTPASDLHLNMVEDWLSQIKNMRAAKMKSDWERLFDSNGKLKSIEELKNFAIEYSSDPSYSGRIDDAYWAWAMSQPDVLAAASDYDTYFHHVGNHSAEIANLQNMSAEWQAVDQSDIFEVIDYLEDHPDSPFKESAKSNIPKALKIQGFRDIFCGAADGSRTRTPIRTQAPQACQSTNSSTAAYDMAHLHVFLIILPRQRFVKIFFRGGHPSQL